MDVHQTYPRSQSVTPLQVGLLDGKLVELSGHEPSTVLTVCKLTSKSIEYSKVV